VEETKSIDVLFILLGSIMVLAMHAGFAFLEVGTVRHKNQVNALVKIISDLAVSAVAYFFVGYFLAYGTNFFGSAKELTLNHGYDLTKFFFLFTFAAAISAIISGGIAERAKFFPQLIATALIVAFLYPFIEGLVWNNNFSFQDNIEAITGTKFHDFAGSAVVHATGGWIALVAVILLGARKGRYGKNNQISSHPPSSIPFLALGSWILLIGWFGFNVMSAQKLESISGLVAINSLMAMAGGTIASLFTSRNDPGFVYNGPLAGLVAVCAGSDIMHPIGSLFLGLLAGFIFVKCFTFTQKTLKIDDVLGVWPLHGICGVFGCIMCGILGQETWGGLGGVSLLSQFIGTFSVVIISLFGGLIIYGLLFLIMGLKLSEEEEYTGGDLTIHKVSSSTNKDATW
jgi:Amt family ammonium transporter